MQWLDPHLTLQEGSGFETWSDGICMFWTRAGKPSPGRQLLLKETWISFEGILEFLQIFHDANITKNVHGENNLHEILTRRKKEKKKNISDCSDYQLVQNS